MTTTKVFANGNSQAVRIPAEYRIAEGQVLIQKIGSTLIILPQTDVWSTFQRGIDGFTDDIFADGRNEPQIQDRAAIFEGE